MISTESVAAPTEAAYSCGPLRLLVTFQDSVWHDALHGLLSQYDAPWPAPTYVIRIVIKPERAPIKTAAPTGTYLHSYRLRVDRHDTRLVSRSNVGVWMEFDLTAGLAHITTPPHSDWPELVEETEQQLVLLLARAWALRGWTPLHAASLIPPGENRCILLCAHSGVGKTTLTATLLRRGWRTLGDDKILLRLEENVMVGRALARRFHLHPSASRWFPEAENISRWPRYSRWTDKRVVQIDEVWSGRLMEWAIPAALVQLGRIKSGIEVKPLDQINTLNTLLRQVAIPNDPEHARPLVSAIAATATKLNSVSLKIGHEAFTDSAVMEHIEEILRRLLP
jgi:hypothetical protein